MEARLITADESSLRLRGLQAGLWRVFQSEHVWVKEQGWRGPKADEQTQWARRQRLWGNVGSGVHWFCAFVLGFMLELHHLSSVFLPFGLPEVSLVNPSFCGSPSDLWAAGMLSGLLEMCLPSGVRPQVFQDSFFVFDFFTSTVIWPQISQMSGFMGRSDGTVFTVHPFQLCVSYCNDDTQGAGRALPCIPLIRTCLPAPLALDQDLCGHCQGSEMKFSDMGQS